jgi:hypothetical protein
MKATIQSWNNKWRYEFEDSEGEIISTEELDTFTGCFSKCLDLVVAENNEAAEHRLQSDGGDALAESELSNDEMDDANDIV